VKAWPQKQTTAHIQIHRILGIAIFESDPKMGLLLNLVDMQYSWGYDRHWLTELI
jgi:hypothetical protein